MKSLANARRSVSAKLVGLELPECFAVATVSAAALATERRSVAAKASRRRLADKAARISAVQP